MAVEEVKPWEFDHVALGLSACGQVAKQQDCRLLVRVWEWIRISQSLGLTLIRTGVGQGWMWKPSETHVGHGPSLAQERGDSTWVVGQREGETVVVLKLQIKSRSSSLPEPSFNGNTR